MDCASTGRVVLRVARCVAESMMALCERLERAWRESSNECVVCESDCGSELVRDERGRVVRRLRYEVVFGSFDEGAGLGEGVSK